MDLEEVSSLALRVGGIKEKRIIYNYINFFFRCEGTILLDTRSLILQIDYYIPGNKYIIFFSEVGYSGNTIFDHEGKAENVLKEINYRICCHKLSDGK